MRIRVNDSVGDQRSSDAICDIEFQTLHVSFEDEPQHDNYNNYCVMHDYNYNNYYTGNYI